MVKLEIPQDYIHVVKKLYPEIEDIFFVDHRVRTLINPMSFGNDTSFIVGVKLLIKRGQTPRGIKQEYAELLDKAFKYTYSDNLDVRFYIEEMELRPELSSTEKFYTLFKPIG